MSFVPYQVDYAVLNTAKTLGFSKKRVTFKFGIANRKAISEGLTGAHCRGSEHEVVFVWSLKTGKRQLFLDGKDVHYSESRQNGWTADRAWQHSFPLKDASGTLKVHFISQSVSKELPDSKPFDLRLNGISYFSFNRIFQLGTPSMMVRDAPRHHSRGRDSPMSPEERRQLAAAKVESIRDLREQQEKSRVRANTGNSSQLKREEESLISFDDDPPPPVPITQQANSQGSGGGNYQQFASSITMDTVLDDRKQSPYGQPPQQQSPYGQPYAQQPSPYGQPPPPPQQQQQQPYGQQPSYGQQQPQTTTALAPYQPPAGQPAPSPYVDATGRVSVGQPPSNAYGYSQQQGSFQQQFGSPQSTASSYASYGSAPTFAQPPRPPTTPQRQSAFPEAQQQPYPQQPYGQQQQQQGYGYPPAPTTQGYPNQAYSGY